MFKIQIYNKIADCGLKLFDKQLYSFEESSAPDAILLRSQNLTAEHIPGSVRAIARAGAGTNNVPVKAMTERGIPVFNTPGANANAVKELVIAGMLLSARHLCEAWRFTHTLEGDSHAFEESVEGAKKQFKGFELPGRTLGVIGLGAIGVKVANTAIALGMRVIGYDPAITVKRAWELSSQVEQSSHLDDLIKQSDFISLHVPLMEQTRDLFNAERLSHARPDAVLLNFSRAEIVNEDAVKKALSENKLAAYVCDFPSPGLQNLKNVITLPHLGASTEEAEDNCAIMAVEELRDFLEHGHIRNSVNFPDIHIPRQGAARLCITNANVPNMVGQISTLLGQSDLNIIEMINKSREEIAYTLIDVSKPVPEAVVEQINAIQGVLNTRVIGL
jgi:D-3-phosphoglycerate dehydrogenase / 2-oxoglutarate reductase